jgi:hypothetical protein
MEDVEHEEAPASELHLVMCGWWTSSLTSISQLLNCSMANSSP